MEKFWNKFKLGTEDACWKWQAAVDSGGYGMTYVNGKHIRVHRMAFLLANGYLPPKGLIRHLCGTRNCGNPNHLAHGTHADNAADAMRTKTFKNKYKNPKRLEEHPNSVLTNDEVISMREMRKRGMSGVAIALYFGKNYSTTMAAISGQNYGSL